MQQTPNIVVSAAILGTLTVAPLLAWLILYPIVSAWFSTSTLIFFAAGFLVTGVIALVGGLLALVLTFRNTGRSERCRFAIVAITCIAVPIVTWLLTLAG